MAVTTTIKNGAIIRKKLTALPKKLARNILRQAIRAAARQLADEVRTRAPVGPTGYLSSSIKSRDSRGERNQVAAKVATDAFYARFVEYGTSKMAAKPFMRPAFDTQKDKLVDLVGRMLAERLEKEVNS